MKGSLRILITALCGLAAMAIVAVLVVAPMFAKTLDDARVTDDRREQLVKLQRVVRRISDLQEEVGRLERALAFFEDRLPEEREIDVILREVWLIAESKSLVPRSVRTSPPEARGRYNAQPITMTFEGKFESFYEFLLGLERLPRITKVRQMQVTKSPVTEGVVQADIMMDIFFEK